MASKYAPQWAVDLADRLREHFPEDLQGQAVYIVSHREIGHAWDTDPDHVARADDYFDLQIQGVLKSFGEWEGPGFACFINRADIFEDMSPDGQWGLIGHELGHWLDRRKDGPVATVVARPELASFIERQWRFSEALSTPVAPPPPWFGHELRYHRAALHVMDRAGIGTREIRAFERYALSPATDYQQAFAGEFGTRRRIRDILNDPVPLAAQELWEADQAKWFAGQSEQVSLPMVGSADSKKGE